MPRAGGREKITRPAAQTLTVARGLPVHFPVDNFAKRVH